MWIKGMVKNGFPYNSTTCFIWLKLGAIFCWRGVVLATQSTNSPCSPLGLTSHDESCVYSQTACRARLHNIDLTPYVISSIYRTWKLHNSNTYRTDKCNNVPADKFSTRFRAWYNTCIFSKVRILHRQVSCNCVICVQDFEALKSIYSHSN
jgi:hypothetical protein